MIYLKVITATDDADFFKPCLLDIRKHNLKDVYPCYSSYEDDDDNKAMEDWIILPTSVISSLKNNKPQKVWYSDQIVTLKDYDLNTNRVTVQSIHED